MCVCVCVCVCVSCTGLNIIFKLLLIDFKGILYARGNCRNEKH